MPLEDLINGKVADMFRLVGLLNVEEEETRGGKRHAEEQAAPILPRAAAAGDELLPVVE